MSEDQERIRQAVIGAEQQTQARWFLCWAAPADATRSETIQFLTQWQKVGREIAALTYDL
jgi:hypothetical protein